MTILLCWLLELSKLRWHGMNRKSIWWAWLHAVCFGVLWDCAFGEVWPWGLLAQTIPIISYLALHDTPEGNWWSKPLWVRKQKCYRVVDGVVDYDHYMVVERPGPDRWHLLSFLSSWPVEIAALWKTSGLPLSFSGLLQSPGWSASSVVLFIIYGLLAASVPFVLWTDLLLKVTGKEWLRMRPTHWAKSLWSR